MSTVIGGIEIQMMADLARLKQDMDQAKAMVGTAAKAMQASGDLVKGVFSGIAAGLTLHAFTAWMKGAIDAGDATKAFAQKTGVAAAEVAGLQLAFKQGGVGTDQLTTGMSKLQKQMVEGNKAFDTLGVKTRNADGTMRGTKDVLYDTADAFASVTDGAAKGALAVEIFGKAGLEMIPTLTEGADGLREMAEMAAKLGLVIDSDTAEAADKFNDTAELLGMGLQGIARQTMAQLLPALNSLAGGFLEGMTTGNALTQVSSALATGMKGLYTVLVGGVQILNTFGKTLGALGGQLAALATGDFKQVMAIGREWMDDIKTDWQGTIKNIGAVWDGSAGQSVDAMAKVTKSQRDLVMQTKEQEDAAKKAAAAAAKLAEDLRKLTVVGDEYLAHQRQANEGTQREIDLGRNLTAAELAQIDLARKLAEGKMLMTAATQASTRAAIDEAGQLAETKKWLQDTTAENIAAFDAITKKTDAVRAETEKQIEANAAIGLTASAVGELRVARLLEMATAADKKAQWEEEFILVNGATSAQRELAQAYRDAAAEAQTGVHLTAAKEAADEWRRAADQINQSLTDSLFRAFESGKGFGRTLRDGLVSMFQTMVLRPVIGTAVSTVAGGFSGTANAAGSSLASPAAVSALASQFPALTAGMSAFGNTLLAGAQSMVGLTGTVAQTSASLASAGYGAGTASGAAIGAGSAAGSALLVALPYVAIAAVVANALGLFRSKTQTQSGLVGTFGQGDIQDATVIRQGGTLFRGPDYKTALGGVSAGSDELQRAFAALRQSTVEQATALGVSTDQVRVFTTAIGSDSLNRDAGTVGLSLQGLSAADAQAKIAAALANANEQMAALVLGFGKTVTESVIDVVSTRSVSEAFGEVETFSNVVRQVSRTVAGAGDALKKTGETAVQTLARLSSSLVAVNGTLGALGHTLFATSTTGADMASKLADAFGGLDNFSASTGAYFDAYYSEAERSAAVTKQLTTSLSALGLSMPASLAGFRGLVEAQDLTSDSGRRTYAALLQMSGAFAALADDSAALQAASQAAAEKAAAAQAEALDLQRRAAEVAGERVDLEKQLLQLQGNTTELRARELAALDPANRALQERINALQDSQAEDQRLAGVAGERLMLEQQLLQLQGKTNELRAIELAALDPSNRALQERITALADERARLDDLAKAGEGVAGLLRDIMSPGGGGKASISSLRNTYQSDLSAAMGGNVDASGRISTSARALLDAVRSNAGSPVELARETSRIAAQLQTLPAVLAYQEKLAGVAGFADGGYHPGGLRMVGENGPELELTGPSRILSARQSSTALLDGDQLAAELRAVRAELTGLRDDQRAQAGAIAANGTRTVSLLKRWDADGLRVKNDADTPLTTVVV
jgi:hypothetical protein